MILNYLYAKSYTPLAPVVLPLLTQPHTNFVNKVWGVRLKSLRRSLREIKILDYVLMERVVIVCLVF